MLTAMTSLYVVPYKSGSLGLSIHLDSNQTITHIVLSVFESVCREFVFECILKCILKYLLMAASTVKIIEISGAFTEVMLTETIMRALSCNNE